MKTLWIRNSIISSITSDSGYKTITKAIKLTVLNLLIYNSINELGHHWFRSWIDVYLAQSHTLNQCKNWITKCNRSIFSRYFLNMKSWAISKSRKVKELNELKLRLVSVNCLPYPHDPLTIQTQVSNIGFITMHGLNEGHIAPSIQTQKTWNWQGSDHR